MASWNQRELEEIEFRIAALKKQQEMWLRFDELFQSAYGAEKVDPKAEEEFLQLKSQIARRQQYLLEYLGSEFGGEPLTDYLGDVVTLYAMREIHPDFYKKLCTRWHKAMINFNAAIGNLQSRLELQIPLEM